MSSAADINAGRAVIGVSLDDANLDKQMQAVNARMKAAAAGAAVSDMPVMVANVYASSMAHLDSQLKSGAISQQQYERAVLSAKNALREQHKAVTDTGTAFDGLKSQIASYVAGFASIATVVSFARQIGAEFEKIEQDALLAEKLGMAADRFEGLKIAAQQADVEFSTVETAMVKMSVAIGKISLKGEESSKWLDRMGITLNDVIGLSADKQFLVIAEAMKKNLSETEQLAAAAEIFGKSSTDMVRMLDITREKLDETTDAAIATGQAIGVDGVTAIRAANDSVDQLSNSWEGLKRSIATTAAPLSGAIDLMAKLVNLHQLYSDLATANLANLYMRNSPAYDQNGFDNAALEKWRKDNSKDAMAARQKDYASQFEAAMESASNDMDRQKALADERAKAEQDVIDQTKAYADQFAQLAEASDRRMQEIIDTREFERKAAEDLAKQTEDYAKMFESAVDEGAKATTGRAWDKERERLAGMTAQGTFSGWRIGQQYGGDPIEKEQLEQLKKLNENVRKINVASGSVTDTFYI